MRIAFVVSYLELTGGHRAVVEIGNRLARRGHDVLLVYPARSIPSRRNDLLRRLGPLAPEAAFVHNGSRLDWADFAGTIVRVPELDDRYVPDADVVVATAWQTAERVARLGSGKGSKVYFIQHYETWSGPEARVDATWRAPFTRVASSEWLRRLGRERFGIDDVHVVPYGVDLEAFHPGPRSDGDGLRVGLLHHLDDWKGVAGTVEAVRRLRREGLDVRLAAFGAFADRGPLPADAELHVLPSRDELRRFYTSLDVFVCGSWSETGPMTVPEAMACGVCVVSTDVGNVSLWTNGGEGAFVVPPCDVDALTTALRTALTDPAERTRRAQRGRDLIQPFTWERAADQFECILRSAA